LLGQPANSLSTLAFMAAAPLVWRRGHRHVASALAATGAGSFLFHGPMVPGSEWAHDVSLVWLLVTVGVAGSRWEQAGGWPALGALGVTIAAFPALGDPLGALAGAGAIGSVLVRQRTRRSWAALVLLGLGALVGRMSATGGPWCRPETLMQGHAFWHLAAAASVILWVTQTTEKPVEEPALL
ncbi:MAG TPA: hypothetical protein VK088_02375, partial [Acidimicrobiia bacterium]|nr:hypothetical protein [Acidimicrobiia bacterium]